MRQYVSPLLGLVLLGIVVGFVLGGVIGFIVMPVRFSDTDVVNLRSPQKDDWVLMVGAAYALDNNLTDAQQRITGLDPDPSVALKYVADVAQRSIDRNDKRNAKNVATLAIALGIGTPALRNYVQSNATPAPTPR
ncbi:MAG: hypothetical protein ABI874_05385 [Chloroflexota bacterium]